MCLVLVVGILVVSFFRSFFAAENERVAKRDRLFDAIARGEMLPEEGETLANDQGVGPLCSVPNAEDFDVKAQLWWTMPMVLAWIIWRNFQRVRDHFDPFRSASPYWHYEALNLPAPDGVSVETRTGYVLKRRGRSTMSEVETQAWLSEQLSEMEIGESRKYRAARDELGKQLCLEALNAIGYRLSDGQAAKIPSCEWAYFGVIEDRGRDFLIYEMDATRTPRYSDVLIRSSEVMSTWKPMKRSTHERREAEQLYFERLSEWMMASPNNPTKTRLEADAYAKSVHGLPRDTAKLIWKKAVAETGAIDWSKAGRRRKIERK